VFVDLGPAAAIDAAVEKFRTSLSDPADTTATVNGRALYDLTMAKVIPHLGGATSVLIAPDGSLNVVPFSALVDDKQQFLIKRFTFTYLTSGRDLLRLNVKTTAQGGGVIFADPTFDGAPDKKTDTPKTRGRRSADLASLAWPALPGTGEEAIEVAKAMKGMTTFRGDKATEGALKAVHGPKILHLATHGFFLPDEPATKVDINAPPQAYENPLLRSGLAFAGANKLRSGTEDGILTAMEATGLDLWGTKLVVLSACETGAGKITNGDGVYGLRRALVIAGAESLVMSLWQVDDAATKELMTGYYKRLVAGKPRSSALRDVQLEIQGRTEYAHPYFWASFLPAGDNTPLSR
jgi:CHAT domain-containing protein